MAAAPPPAPAAGGDLIKIADLKPWMRNVNCQFIVLNKSGPSSTTRDGNVVHHLLVADASASINMSLWDEFGDVLQEGDIIRLTNGAANLHKNSLNLYMGKTGQIKRVGRFTMIFTETPNLSTFIHLPDGTLKAPSAVPSLAGAPPAPLPQQQQSFSRGSPGGGNGGGRPSGQPPQPGAAPSFINGPRPTVAGGSGGSRPPQQRF